MTVHRPPRIGTRWWVVTAAGAVLAVLGGIVLLGGTLAPDGSSWLENPGAVIVTLIGGLTTILAQLIPRLDQLRTMTAATTESVVNSHTQGMRDDLDGKHDDVMRTLERIERRQDGMARDVGRIDTRVNQVVERLDYTTRRLDTALERIDDIEDTTPPRKKE